MSNDKLDSSFFRIDRLGPQNYYLWSNEMEIMLRGKGIWKHVEGSAVTPTDEAKLATHERNQVLALANIMMSINPARKASVLRLGHPKEVWKTLKVTYQMVSEASIDAKLSALQEIGMATSESILEYSNRIKTLTNELLAIGHRVSDIEKKRALLRGLSPNFSVIAQVIRATGKTY